MRWIVWGVIALSCYGFDLLAEFLVMTVLYFLVKGWLHQAQVKVLGQQVHSFWTHVRLAWSTPLLVVLSTSEMKSASSSASTSVCEPGDNRAGAIQFTYMDADGDVTSRRVDVSHAGRQHFEGYCHLRRATRTFRYDRVIGDITDLDTGEILSPEDWRRAA